MSELIFHLVIHTMEIIFAIYIYIDMYCEIKKQRELLRLMKIGINNRDMVIYKMADNMTTDNKNIEWIKKYYQSEVENEILRKALREKENE